MKSRTLRAVLTLCLVSGCGPLVAQDYTNNFSAIKVDRGKGPATFHNGFSVDPPTGALSVDIPLGPGIGNSKIHFTPTLRSRWSPQWSDSLMAKIDTQLVYNMVNIPGGIDGPPLSTSYSYTNVSKGQRAGGFDNWFGGLQLVLSDPPNTALTTGEELQYQSPGANEDSIAEIQFPDGTRNSILIDQLGLQPAGSLPTPAQVSALLQAFGYDASWQIAPDPLQSEALNSDGTAQTPCIHMDGAGDLIIGLWNKGGATAATGSLMSIRSYVLPTDNSPNLPSPITTPSSNNESVYTVPGIIVVIRGDTLVEYDVSRGYFTGPIQVLDNPVLNSANSVSLRDAICFCLGANYQTAKIVDRFQDTIKFDYSGASPVVTWSPKEGGAGASISFGSTIQYTGGTQNPSFQILNGPVSPSPETASDNWHGLKPILNDDWFPGGVTDLATGEQVTFGYTDFPAPVAPGGIADIQSETVLSSATVDSRSLSFTWGQYSYRYGTDDNQNQSNQADGNGNIIANTFLPHLAMGVTSFTETDTKTSVTRTEGHTRVQPAPNLVLQNGAHWWKTTSFYDAITHPDGRITVNVYVQPPQKIIGTAPSVYATPAIQMQVKAYAKHQIQEVREYAAPASGGDPNYWQADLQATLTSPGSSLAYRVTEYDRWDFHDQSNPFDVYGLTAVPHPTRTRVWDANNQILSVTETTGWDSTNRGYATTTTWTCSSSASLSGVDYLAVDYPSSGTTLSSPAGVIRQEQTVRQLSAVPSQWIFDRVLNEAHTVISDTSAGLAAGQTFPFADPPLAYVYNPDTFDQVGSITHGWANGPFTTTTLGYGTGSTQGHLMSAVVTGQDGSGPMINSGSVGATFGYDSNGYMNLIKPTGVAWSYGQSQDGFGLAQTQTDPNGLVTTYQWDGGSRLTGIQPPAPEVGTQIQMDPDNLGFTVTRGMQVSNVRFNAFGEMVMEQRSTDGTTSWSSHKNTAYDAAGRKTGETIWNPGPGNEIQSASPNMTTFVTHGAVIEPGYWDTEVTSTGKQITVWIPPVTQIITQTVPALSFGYAWTYDGQGRLVQSMDANGITAATTYGVRTKTVTVGTAPGAVTTTFSSDEVGRLYQITDAKGQITQYAYDPANRLKRVTQSDPSTGAQQVRTWNYDSLGRLTSLTQPESGTTAYSAFTVTGKPTQTVYGVGSGSPRTVTTSYDALDRVQSVVASDGSVNESFGYGGSGHGLAAGKLTSASASGVTRSLVYGELNGRLSSLTRTVDGQSFTLGLGYDAYGNLTSRTYPDGKTQGIPYDLARGVPNGATLNGANLATLGYDPVHWGLTALTYANGGNSFFGYDTDQTRLKTMSHLAGSQTLANWTFQYDSRGNLLTDGEDAYSYDELDRLILSYIRDPQDALSGHGLTQLLDYDAFGNRSMLSSMRVTNWTGAASPASPSLVALSSSDTRALVSFSMNSSELAGMALTNHLPATLNGVGTGSAYDAQGNLTSLWPTPGSSSGQLTMGYDALGRLTSLADAKRGTTEKYTYDDEGLRIMVEVWQGATLQSKKYMIYNESRQLVAEYDLVLE